MRQPAGERETTAAVATVMATGNAAPPPPRWRRKMTETTSVEDADPAGSTRMAPWSLAVLIADDADGGDGSVAVVSGAFEDAVARAGTTTTTALFVV